MYRDCYTMKLAYPCEADGCRCGSGCLRTRPDCNRTADISIHAPREGCDSKLYQRAESLLGSICLFAQGEEG